MDKIFRLTSSEYAKLLDLSNEALRSRRRRNLEDGNFIKIGKEFFWKTPVRGRPDMVLATANDRGLKYGIPGSRSLKRKRRRGSMKTGDTNYHNAPNGWQLEQLNQVRALGKIRDGLGDDVVDELSLEMFELAKKKLAKKKEKEFKKEMEKAQRPPTDRIVGLDYTPTKYGTRLNSRGLKNVDDNKHQQLLRRDNQKYTSKYVYKYDYAGKGYYSNQFDFSDPGQGSTKFGSGNNRYYEVGVPIDDGSVYFDDRDLPPDDREPRFESKVQESIWRLKNNK